MTTEERLKEIFGEESDLIIIDDNTFEYYGTKYAIFKSIEEMSVGEPCKRNNIFNMHWNHAQFLYLAGFKLDRQATWEKQKFYDVDNPFYKGRVQVEYNPNYGDIIINADDKLIAIENEIKKSNGYRSVDWFSLLTWFYHKLLEIRE